MRPGAVISYIQVYLAGVAVEIEDKLIFFIILSLMSEKHDSWGLGYGGKEEKGWERVRS